VAAFFNMRFFKPILIIILMSGAGLISCGGQAKRIPALKNDLSGFLVKTDKGDCQVLSDRIDPVTTLRKTDMAPVHIFSHTHPKLREYFTDGPFLRCEASLSKVGKESYFLQTWYIFHPRTILSNYNGLAEESMLRIDLINGEKVILSNVIQDDGTVNPDGHKIFKAMYLIPKKELSILKKWEIARMGVVWNGGFEEYEVHEIDFIMRQLECFSQIL